MTLSPTELRTMIDGIPSLAWSCLPDGKGEFLNQRWLEYTGLSQAQALGWGWQAAVHPEDLEPLMTKWRAALASGEGGEAEARLRSFDGEYRWFLFRALPALDDRGTIVRWYGTNADIEDLKRAEKEIRDVVDFVPQFIVVLGPEGNRLHANQAILDYLGCTLAELQAPDFHRTVAHPDDIERMTTERHRMSCAAPFEYEVRMRRRDGVYRWFLFRYKPLLCEDGRVLRWYATATEIEERKRAEERTQRENLALREEIDKTSMFEEIVGTSPALQAVLARVAKVAPTESTVLITGDTGTGKELIARAIHKRSARASGAFVGVNCAGIPQSLIASELFGHEKGAFTGALQRRLGRFELAEGGTLFLDEIGELPGETQIALLRVLQEREFERVGGSRAIQADIRLITATNRDLEAAIADGTFRNDLFYRLNVFPIHIPPLRERRDDIPMLVEYFIERYAAQAGKKFRNVSNRSMQLLSAYDWPGNIRELQNVIERSVVVSETDTFSVDESWLSRNAPAKVGPVKPLAQTMETQEKAMIEAALTAARGRVSGPLGAAAKLFMPASTLESKIRSLRIDKLRFKAGR